MVLPLLSMSSSVLLCISTLRENDNFYSRMFQMRKPDGNLLFETIQIDLVCEACRASDHPERYVIYKTPPDDLITNNRFLFRTQMHAQAIGDASLAVFAENGDDQG